MKKLLKKLGFWLLKLAGEKTVFTVPSPVPLILVPLVVILCRKAEGKFPPPSNGETKRKWVYSSAEKLLTSKGYRGFNRKDIALAIELSVRTFK